MKHHFFIISVELFQMKLKMQYKELEIQIVRLKKMKELLDNRFLDKKKLLEDIKRNDKLMNEEQKQLSEQVKELKIREQELYKENENLMKKVHHLTQKSSS